MSPEPYPEVAPTRDRICEAAFALFGEKGYDGASMSELAERVGLAKPSIYNYFKSKEELLVALVEEAMRQWKEHCLAPVVAAGTFERQLAVHLRQSVEFSSRSPHVVAVFHMATTHVQGELALRIQTMVEAVEAEIQQVFGASLARAIESGEVPAEGDVADRILFLGVFFHGLLFLQTNCPHQVGPLRARLEPVWRQLFRGVVGRPPQEPLFP